MKHTLHLKSSYPKLAGLFDQVGPIPELRPVDVPVPEAITKIVIGQMLSRSAARTIYARVEELRDSQGLCGSWKLSATHLAKAGLSRRKIRTIKEFGNCYDERPDFFERWRYMDFAELSGQMSKQWGLSQWSASILALFYFANDDVFPASDGSIRRVISALEAHGLIGPTFESASASPYRSYLALYLWAMLDHGIVSN